MKNPKIIEAYDIYEYLEIISEILEVKSFKEFMNMDTDERNYFKKEIKSRIREEKINTLIEK